MRDRRRTNVHLESISRPGRIAGYTTAGCLALGGFAFSVAGGVVVMCVRGCAVDPALAGIALFVAVPVLLVGIASAWSVARRPVYPDGSSAWTWGVGLVFAAGIVFAATRLPTYTCPTGLELDANFPICFDPAGHRYAAESWLWLQRLLTAGGVVLGLTVMRSVRAVAVTAPIAALAWTFGLGWLLEDTLGRGLSR